MTGPYVFLYAESMGYLPTNATTPDSCRGPKNAEGSVVRLEDSPSRLSALPMSEVRLILARLQAVAA